MDTAFIIVVAINLLFLSALVIFRMVASGVPAGRIAQPVIELWVAFGLWIAIFRSLAAAIGVPHGASAVGGTGSILARFSKLPADRQAWLFGGVLISVALLVHLLWTIGRAMRGDIHG